jgi:two-component system response regulator DegU
LFLSEPFRDLTSREQEILVNLAEGLSNEEIAEKLYISIKTVKNHVSSIYRKTGFRERAKLVLAARSILG